MSKIRQAIVKRFKITKTGKILRRLAGQNHFRAKKSGKKIRQLRKWVPVSKAERRQIKQLLYYAKRK
jgi:large subunit ribosomal protein L35